jgi:hypothetical protein
MRVAILVLGLMAAACGPGPQSAENLPTAPGTVNPERPYGDQPVDPAVQPPPPANPS